MKIKKNIKSARKGLKKSNRRRNKQVLQNIKKTIAPILLSKITDILVNAITQSSKLQELVDKTNEFIDAADTSQKIQQAIVLKNNAIKIINDQEKKLEIIRTLTNDPSFQIKSGEAGIEAVRIPQFKTIDTDARGRIWLDPSSRFKHVEFLDVKAEDVTGKLVIIGVAASGVSSVVATPNGEKFSQDVQAQALLSVFTGTTPVR